MKILAEDIDSPHVHRPYSFYDAGMCLPGDYEKVGSVIGEVLSGEMWYSSPYSFELNKYKSCELVCTKELEFSNY